MRQKMQRGFTMVELIAAIVIIGIAFLSVPMAMQVSNKAIEFTQTSRGFYHGLAKMKIITSLPWDENSVDSLQTQGYYQALQTQQDQGATPTELACNTVTLSRAGHYVGSETALYRRRCSGGFASGSLGVEASDGTSRDDLDDYSGDTTGYSIESVFQVTSTVVYVPYNNTSPQAPTFNSTDAAATQSTSIKRVSLNINENGQNVGNYYYYATNIGTYQPVKKANW